MAAFDYTSGGFPASPATDDTLAMKGTTYKYNGSAWEVQTGGTTSYVYTATSGQTAFTGADSNSKTLAYSAGNTHVFLNGVLLDAADYTATDGTTVTLGTGASTGDTLQIVAYGVLVSAGGGGGAWEVISNTVVTSSVASVEITLSGYDMYRLMWRGLNFGSNAWRPYLDITKVGGTFTENLQYSRMYKSESNAFNSAASTGNSLLFPIGQGTATSNTNWFGDITIFNDIARPSIHGTNGHTRDSSNAPSIGVFSASIDSWASGDKLGKVKFLSEGDIEAGTFTLYGIKTS